MWNIIGPIWMLGALVALLLMMFYLMEDRYMDFEVLDTLNHIDEFFKFTFSPQIVIYNRIESKLRLSGIIICEIFASLFFLAFNIIIFIFLFIAKLFQLLWLLFVKIFGRKEEDYED